MDLKLSNVRLSFPNLFEAKEFKPGDGKPRFDATFLVEPGSENDKAIRAAIAAEAAAVFGAKATALLRQWDGNNNKVAYCSGDLKQDYDGFAGMMYLACHSKVRPGVFDNVRDPATGKARVIRTSAEGRPYAGCFVNAKVSIYAQKGENPGIRASFSGVQFWADGVAFAGGATATADDFEDLVDGAAADDLV